MVLLKYYLKMWLQFTFVATTLSQYVFLDSCVSHAGEKTILPKTSVYNEPARRMAVKKIRLGEKTLTVEIADNNELRSRGLMFRKSLEKDHGMLFVFDHEQPLAFWMKNTLMPLSIGYFSKEKKLVDIIEMIPAVAGDANPKNYPSALPAMYALEVPKGWFSINKIRIGASFIFVEKKTASH